MSALAAQLDKHKHQSVGWTFAIEISLFLHQYYHMLEVDLQIDGYLGHCRHCLSAEQVGLERRPFNISLCYTLTSSDEDIQCWVIK